MSEKQGLGHAVVIDAPGDALPVEFIINCVLVVAVLVLYVQALRHFDVALASPAVYEESVRPGGPGQGREPVVANHKILSQRVDHRQAALWVVGHDLSAFHWRALRIRPRKVGNKSTAVILDLAQDIGSIVIRVTGDVR